MIELPRKRAVSLASAFIGALFVFVGLVALQHAPLAARGFFVVLGALLLGFGLARTLSRTPRFRATDAGVWFGGGALIPWSDVKQVFSGGVAVDRKQTSSIAFELHRTATLFRTPIEHWLSSPFSLGHIDVSPPVVGDRADVIAARIDAMRVRATEHPETTAS